MHFWCATAIPSWPHGPSRGRCAGLRFAGGLDPSPRGATAPAFAVPAVEIPGRAHLRITISLRGLAFLYTYRVNELYLD